MLRYQLLLAPFIGCCLGTMIQGWNCERRSGRIVEGRQMDVGKREMETCSCDPSWPSAPLCDFLFRGPLGPKYRRAGGCQVGSRLADMLAHRICTFSHRLTYCSQGFSTTSCGFTQSQAETRCICLWKTRFPYRLACRNGSLSSSLARGRHSDPSDYHSCISLVYLVRHCRSFESC